MKRLLFISCLLVFLLGACKKNFLEIEAPNVITVDALANKTGVQQLLVGAYHDVTGLTIHSGWWSTSGTNWVYGDITSGDAYRGGGNDGNDGVIIEHFQTVPSTGYLADKWRSDYDGVSRSNAVILAANKATDMSAAEKTKAIAEARFLRGHFHFDAKKIWNNVPYVDDAIALRAVVEGNKIFTTLSNTENIWPKIEADFRFAFNNLPTVQSLKGAANKWAAGCYLAKCYMFEKNFTAAKALLDSIIPSAYGGHGTGVNSQGKPYALVTNFDDNFNAATENNAEQVFQIQFSVNDGSNGGNENIGESANTPAFYPLSSFYTTWKQPSFNLVNAFKTDADGLPMLDTFNTTNMKNDQNISFDDYSYSTYQGTVDPRLDWTVGRRGVPYLDWADGNYYTGYPSYPSSDPNLGWINDRSFGGPYSPVKNNYRSSQVGLFSDNYAQGYLLGSAVNYSIIRFADVLLWAAECEVEVGTLDRARTLVNYIRNRAATGRMVEVSYDYIGNYEASANYYVDLYNTPWTDKATATKAVRFERRLEFALEGHRFFDLVRWGVAAAYINNYISTEKNRVPNNLVGINFTASKNEYFPIPQQEIDLNPNLKQNPGY
ncbi:MAG TPA: RagB/SusD family nutrient uptake outer membrane protein [Chitinophagaceae bacterium]|nr:RagB/SusD family nutrient uptake outer membrane protein [Chitinophagaceae bacterium]